jgi:XisH protein
MPARDTIHDTIKNALIKDGWTILADPYFLRYEDKSLIADLKAAKIFLARRETETIVVEVKSFLSTPFLKELQTALGQYHMYVAFLEALERNETVYLAIGDVTFQEYFQSQAVQMLLRRYGVKLIVVDEQQEEIVQWIR